MFDRTMSIGTTGGYDIDIEEAPYQVNYGDICGAVLIHHWWAITVAHCGTEDFIRVGSKYRLKGTKVHIKRHFVHPLYKYRHEFDYDAQLLQLRRALKCRRKCVVDISKGEHGDFIYVSGWGYAVEKGDYMDILQQVRIDIVAFERCQNISHSWYNHSLTGGMFCAGDETGDACQGDSGGAAVSFDRLVGLSSFGYGCGRGIPGVYTNVSSPNIRVWIKRKTGI